MINFNLGFNSTKFAKLILGEIQLSWYRIYVKNFHKRNLNLKNSRDGRIVPIYHAVHSGGAGGERYSWLLHEACIRFFIHAKNMVDFKGKNAGRPKVE